MLRSVSFSRQLSCFFILFISLLIAGCKTKKNECPKQIITCGAEKVSKDNQFLLTSVKDIKTGNKGTRSDLLSRTGYYSCLLDADKKYGFTTKLYDFKPQEFFRISVWRKGGENGVLVADGFNNKEVYFAKKKSSKKDSAGWDQLVLDFFIPSFQKFKELRVYVWNTGDDTIFFDDLRIEQYPDKPYPEYTQPYINLIINDAGIQKLTAKRTQALKLGILENTDDDYVKGVIAYNGDTMKANIRLKGDWLDHLRGSKWSFRIKIKGQKAWRGMRSFSLQSPETRGFLNEWILHNLFKQEDVLTTRYGFVPIRLNGKNLGIYAYEEHFDRHLLEYNQRREGPILKFNEDHFWRALRIISNTNLETEFPLLKASLIEPFKKNRTLRNTQLYNEFISAQNLLYQFKMNLKPVSEIFNIDALAKFYALLDITKGYHGFRWHNIRFYYNPVIAKLEPIGFDCFIPGGIFNLIDEPAIGLFQNDTVKKPYEHLVFLYAFTDTKFVAKYYHYLEEYSSPEFLSGFFRQISKDLHVQYDYLYKEFAINFPDTSFYFTNAVIIRNSLHDKKINKPQSCPVLQIDQNPYSFDFYPEMVPYLVQPYRMQETIFIKNYLPEKIHLTGYYNSSEYVKTKDVPVNRFSSTSVKIGDEVNKITIIIGQNSDTFQIETIRWPYPKDYSPQQDIYNKYSIKQFNSFFIIDNKNIIIQGKHVLKNPLIIPEGYQVLFKAGTELDLINNAIFITYSPVTMNGRQTNPVIIKSSDGNSMGFHVLLAKEKSEMKYVIFDQQNTLKYKGWQLTSAVTFYESDVSMRFVKFINTRCEDALNIIRSKFELSNCTFDNIFSDAFDSDFSRGIVKNSLFKDIGNDAIDFSGSNVTVENCTIENPGDKGISGGERSILQITDSKINGANIAVASKDLTNIYLNNCTIENCNYGLVVFKKKPEFGPATIISEETNLQSTLNETFIEKGSKVILEQDTLYGSKKKVADMFYIKY